MMPPGHFAAFFWLASWMSGHTERYFIKNRDIMFNVRFGNFICSTYTIVLCTYLVYAKRSGGSLSVSFLQKVIFTEKWIILEKSTISRKLCDIFKWRKCTFMKASSPSLRFFLYLFYKSSTEKLRTMHVRLHSKIRKSIKASKGGGTSNMTERGRRK